MLTCHAPSKTDRRRPEEVRTERRKETKNDAAVALAATLHERGREGVEEEWERTDAFHERWKLKARDMLARGEWRKRKLTKRVGAGLDGPGLGVGARRPARAFGACLGGAFLGRPAGVAFACAACRLLSICIAFVTEGHLPQSLNGSSKLHQTPAPPPVPPPANATPQMKEEEDRAGEEHKEAVAHAKEARAHHKAWESSRETRVSTWRDYVKGSKGKAKAPAQLKPPKQKTHDEDKLYVQRPVGEQFRPPAPKPAGH